MALSPQENKIINDLIPHIAHNIYAQTHDRGFVRFTGWRFLNPVIKYKVSSKNMAELAAVVIGLQTGQWFRRMNNPEAARASTNYVVDLLATTSVFTREMFIERIATYYDFSQGNKIVGHQANTIFDYFQDRLEIEDSCINAYKSFMRAYIPSNVLEIHGDAGALLEFVTEILKDHEKYIEYVNRACEFPA